MGLIEDGDTNAAEGLVSLTYDELKRIAAHLMAIERPGHTLQATALVHEAYIRLAKGDGQLAQWHNRGHFFSAAAEAMRRILIESARKKLAKKRGGGAMHTVWDDSRSDVDTPPADLLEVDGALAKLEAEDPALATVVKLRFFVGMTIPETASALDSSPRKVSRQWSCARAWLQREISESREPR